MPEKTDVHDEIILIVFKLCSPVRQVHDCKCSFKKNSLGVKANASS